MAVYIRIIGWWMLHYSVRMLSTGLIITLLNSKCSMTLILVDFGCWTFWIAFNEFSPKWNFSLQLFICFLNFSAGKHFVLGNYPNAYFIIQMTWNYPKCCWKDHEDVAVKQKKIPLKYDDKETEMTLYQIVGASILARNKKQNKNSSG